MEGGGTGSSWKQLGQDFDDEADGDQTGSLYGTIIVITSLLSRSVSLSSDGKTLAIGAYNSDGNGDNSGHVMVYHMDGIGPSWKQLGQDIDGQAVGDNCPYPQMTRLWLSELLPMMEMVLVWAM